MSEARIESYEFDPIERLAPVIPLPVEYQTYTENTEPGEEFLWSMDFKDEVLATRVMSKNVRTYGELATLSLIELEDLGVDELGIKRIGAMLLAKGLQENSHDVH